MLTNRIEVRTNRITAYTIYNNKTERKLNPTIRKVLTIRINVLTNRIIAYLKFRHVSLSKKRYIILF